MDICKGYLFMLLVIHIRNPSGAFEDIYDAGKELVKLYSMIDRMNDNTTHNVKGSLSNNSVTYRDIRIQMDKIHDKMDQIDEFMNPMPFCNSFRSFDVLIYSSLVNLEIFILSIKEYYQQFYQSIIVSDFYPSAFPNSMQTVLNVEEKIGVIRKITSSASSLLPNAADLLFPIVNFASTKEAQLCGMHQTISSALVKLFRMVMITEIKANIMLAHSSTQQFADTVGWRNKNLEEQFEMYFGTYVNLFTFYIPEVETMYLRACEPDSNIWIRNQTFYELEGTFQKTIFRYNWMKCKFDNCDDLWFGKASECDVGYYDDRSGCEGTPAQCTDLKAIQACVLKTGPYKFQYVNSTAIGSLGKNFECPENDSYIIEHGSGWDFTTGTCACDCYRNHNKISLLIMESRESANMVITGLRFVRKDGILYIQPKEGKLGAYGYIFPHSERWIPIPKNTRTSQIHSINREHRVFFLDDLHLDSGFVLTGVKFNKVTRGNVTGFAIQIFGVQFNHESGELNLATIFGKSKQASNEDSGQPVSFQARSSLHTTLPLTPSPSIKKYISMERSELSGDFGQSTLPFFDAVPIAPVDPSPLGGVGIFHKGTEGYAGFISLRVYGIKYAQYFTDFESRLAKNPLCDRSESN